jgi:hypothetical protein
MPDLARITSTFFTNLINRLGIRPPFGEGFVMSNVVTPVSLVDSDITIPTVTTPPIFGTPFTTGVNLVPAINTVIADTGPLAAGTWAFLVMISVLDSAGAGAVCDLQHRNAANAANIWDQETYSSTNAPCNMQQFVFAKTMAANERLRAINLTAGTAASRWQVTIFAVQLS